MKPLALIVSITGLGLTVIPAFLVFSGRITWDTHAELMLLGTAAWFFSAPFWMGMKD
jgi:hypothetical protein